MRLLRAMPREQLALRAALLATALAVYLLLPGRAEPAPGFIAALALIAGLGAAGAPDSDAALLSIGAAALSWLVEYGGTTPAYGRTLALGALLYLQHLLAALAASTPPHAVLDVRTVRRWLIPLAAGWLGLAASSVLVFGLPGPPLSTVGQVAGLAGCLLAAGAVTLLARSRPH